MNFKKAVSFLLVFTLLITLAGCTKQTVEVKIPKELYTEQGLVKDGNLEKGIEDIIEEEDQVIVVMTENKHKEVLSEIEEFIALGFKAMVEGEETKYIKDIKHDKGFKNIDIYMDKTQYEESFDVSFFVAGMYGLTYQIYNLQDPNVKLRYLEEGTDKEFFSINFPKDMEENLKNEEKAEKDK